jgi:tetratricopeptide (TPR) repeat protein
MANESKIQIKSKRSPEFSTTITVNNVSYLVQTEDLGRKSSRIVTNIYLKGEIIESKKSDYSHLAKLEDFESRLEALMDRQHRSTIDAFKAELSKNQKQTSDYFKAVQQCLKRGNGREAMEILREGLSKYPADPFLLSYYGCLLAIVENNPKEGIKICEHSIKELKKTMPFGSEFFYPVFYLNLGRAYVQAGRKSDAMKAFNNGLKNDPTNRDILSEIDKLGTRRTPPIPFLKRSNPINKYIGMLLSKKS